MNVFHLHCLFLSPSRDLFCTPILLALMIETSIWINHNWLYSFMWYCLINTFLSVVKGALLSVLYLTPTQGELIGGVLQNKLKLPALTTFFCTLAGLKIILTKISFLWVHIQLWSSFSYCFANWRKPPVYLTANKTRKAANNIKK